MRKAIVTKYHPATNKRGARVSATSDAGRVTLSWDYEFDARENHRLVAETHARQLQWSGTWRGGYLPKGLGYAFVNACDGDGFTVEVE